MDERTEKEEINYHPEMAGWGDDEQSIKEKSMGKHVMEHSKGKFDLDISFHL